MRFSVQKAVFWVLLVLVAWPVGVSGFPVIASQHKYNPDHEKRVSSNTVQVVTSGDVKQRPDSSRADAAPIILDQKISSKTAIVINAKTGKTVYALNPDSPRQPASTIKVITGLISINSLKNTELVRASRRAARMPRSKIYLKPGKSYYATDLINAVLMASANDASVALAEKIAGTEKAFAKLMTSKAEALGAKRTICKSASGLTYRGQHSTARDLAVMFNKAMEEEEFAKRMSLTKVRTRHGIILRTHNKALWRVDGAEGGKTGYTSAARQTYVGKFSRGGNEIVVAIMGSETMWKDIKYLVEYGFDRIERTGMAATAGSDSNAHLVTLQTLSPKPMNSLLILSDTKKISNL